MKPKIINGPKGLKILICNNQDNLTTALLILVKAGTDWERKEINGISHFIEHLYFKGTKNFPTSKILLENIDKIAGIHNAFTGHEYTGFYIKVLPEYVQNALFILTDIIINPLFPSEEIEKERNVIFEEINLYEDTPSQLIIDLGTKLVFGDQPAGFSILGNKKTISKITRRQIIDYVNTNYSTKNMLIILAGNIKNESNLVSLIRKKFESYRYHQPPQKKAVNLKKIGYQEKIHFKNVEQAHIFLGFPLPGIFELKDKRYFLNLLSIILGEKSSSRLWLKVREELGGAYYIRSSFLDYTDRSLFIIHAGVSLENLTTILKEIVEEINNLKKYGINDDELGTSKTILKSSLFMDLEEALNVALIYGKQYLLENKIFTPKEIEKKINLVTRKDLEEELKKIFTFKNLKFAIITPPKIKINYKKIFQNLD